MIVKPTVPRKIDEYKKYIEEFFKENIHRVQKTNKVLFECDFVDGKLVCCEYSRKTVDDLLSKMKVDEQTLISILREKSVSGYK